MAPRSDSRAEPKIENGHLVLTPSGRIHYSDGTGRSVQVWHGEYEVDETVFTSPGISTEASRQIIANPEPSSVLLLLTTLAVIARLIVRKRRTAAGQCFDMVWVDQMTLEA